ncbi:hypothetical protein CBW18_18165 [Pedobacter sp. AJM]|nr:hypothetical protein CBW18_18165 [Pedobacter sp. AJM]
MNKTDNTVFACIIYELRRLKVFDRVDAQIPTVFFANFAFTKMLFAFLIVRKVNILAAYRNSKNKKGFVFCKHLKNR